MKPEASAKLEAASSWIHSCLTEREPEGGPPAAEPSAWSQEDLEGFTESMLLDLRAAFEHFIEAFNHLRVSLSRGGGPLEKGGRLGKLAFHQSRPGPAPDSAKPAEEAARRGGGAKPISEASLKSIYIYDLAGRKNGFMLFRQGRRLTFAPEAPGRIRIRLARKALGRPGSAGGIGGPETIADSCLRAVANNAISLGWVHDKYPGFVDIDALAHYYMKLFLQDISKGPAG